MNTASTTAFPELHLRAENPTTPQPLRVVPRRKSQPTEEGAFDALLDSAKLANAVDPRRLLED